MSTRIRGQELSGYFVVDGKLLLGSFAKLESFKFSPTADLATADFLGETESEPDVQHHGYELSWTIHELDNQAVAVYLNLVSKLNTGDLLPQVNFVVVKTYRDPAVAPTTLVFQNMRFKLDSQDAGSRKDYVKNSFSAKCRTMKVL